MAEHNNGYKLLFSHAEMVADLLRGFVHEDWVRDLNFSTLEKVPGSYVSDGLRGRESDIVWRLRWGRERWLYVYLLLEFQSTVDPFMAVRVMTYVGLLYQDLIRQRSLTPAGKLPPVLPLVLYNGNQPWGAGRDVGDLVEDLPGGLDRYRPRLEYFLLDEARIADGELAPLRNVTAALFRLEKSRGPEDIQAVLDALLDWLRGAQYSELKRAFAAWIVQVLLPARLPGIEVPRIGDLKEIRSMLAESALEWTRQWKQEGFQEGLQKGRQEGLQKGIQKGAADILEQARRVLAQDLERRFGPLPEEAGQRLGAIDSIEEMMALSSRVPTAPSLADLGLL